MEYVNVPMGGLAHAHRYIHPSRRRPRATPLVSSVPQAIRIVGPAASIRCSDQRSQVRSQPAPFGHDRGADRWIMFWV
jgi:hypothetical protein